MHRKLCYPRIGSSIHIFIFSFDLFDLPYWFYIKYTVDTTLPVYRAWDQYKLGGLGTTGSCPVEEAFVFYFKV